MLRRLACPKRAGRLAIGGIERLRMPLGQFYEFGGKACYPVRMALLYLAMIRTAYFVSAGVGRDFENAPPHILLELVRGAFSFLVPPSLGLALLLGLPPPFFSLSLLFRPSLRLTALCCFLSFSLPFLLCSLFSPTFLAHLDKHPASKAKRGQHQKNPANPRGECADCPPCCPSDVEPAEIAQMCRKGCSQYSWQEGHYDCEPSSHHKSFQRTQLFGEPCLFARLTCIALLCALVLLH